MTLQDRIAKVIKHRFIKELEWADEHAELRFEPVINETAAAIVNEFKEFIKDAE